MEIGRLIFLRTSYLVLLPDDKDDKAMLVLWPPDPSYATEIIHITVQ